jgi:hypothetical protein
VRGRVSGSLVNRAQQCESCALFFLIVACLEPWWGSKSVTYAWFVFCIVVIFVAHV